MSTISTVCRRCGQEYTPTRNDLLAGPHVWHHCPACRPVAAGETPTPPTDRSLRHG